MHCHGNREKCWGSFSLDTLVSALVTYEGDDWSVRPDLSV